MTTCFLLLSMSMSDQMLYQSKDDAILSVWDTQGDAIQAGCERFGIEPIFVKKIDPRDAQRFALVFAQRDSECPS